MVMWSSSTEVGDVRQIAALNLRKKKDSRQIQEILHSDCRTFCYNSLSKCSTNVDNVGYVDFLFIF